MNQELISLISTFINLLLTIFKLLVGLMMGSIALIADSIHSGMDIISSFVTFLGIKISKKPIDEKHPYGHQRAEALAGFIVVVILGISGIWIIYESLLGFFKHELITFTYLAIGVTLFSIIVNEIMARLKFYYGQKHKSLSLVADAEHSRADAISSVGVLFGMIAIKYFSYADILIALAIGIYILKETFVIGKEITDSLLDVANKEMEKQIKKICFAHKIEISQIKTRRIGSSNFAEIKIKLSSGLKVEDVQNITDALEERLLTNIEDLSYVVIAIESYNMTRSVILPKLGKKIGNLKDFEKIGPQKLGKRIIIPLQNTEISNKFGAPDYLVIDKDKKGLITKNIFKNPYYNNGPGHGSRFAKAIRADKIIAREVGLNAKSNLNIFGIDIEIVKPDLHLNDILKSLED